jgi:CheY-like chemotaxis protein
MAGPRRVLVVEDYDDSREMYVEYLALRGYEVNAARDGLEALAAALAFHPDVMLLDMRLPKLDGYSVLRKLRADPGTALVCAIALSGAGEADYEERALAAGASLALKKPCMPEELIAAIEALVAQTHRGV